MWPHPFQDGLQGLYDAQPMVCCQSTHVVILCVNVVDDCTRLIKYIAVGLSLSYWVIILHCRSGDHWGLVGRVIGVVDAVGGMIKV